MHVKSNINNINETIYEKNDIKLEVIKNDVPRSNKRIILAKVVVAVALSVIFGFALPSIVPGIAIEGAVIGAAGLFLALGICERIISSAIDYIKRSKKPAKNIDSNPEKPVYNEKENVNGSKVDPLSNANEKRDNTGGAGGTINPSFKIKKSTRD